MNYNKVNQKSYDIICRISFVALLLLLPYLAYCQNSPKTCQLDSCQTEGFENGGLIPTCWTQEYVTGTTNWQFAQGNPYPAAPNAAFAGSYNAFFGCSSGCINNETRLVAGPIRFNPLLSASLSFRVHNPAGVLLKIYYKTSSTGSWTLIPTTIQSSNGTWMNYVVNLPNPSTDYYIAFDAKLQENGVGICIDNVIWCQQCPVPTVTSIIGPTTFCSFVASGPWSVTPESGVTYEWQSSNNSVLSYGTTFANSFNASAFHTITVTPIGACGSGNSVSTVICVTIGPPWVPTPVGETSPCVGSTQTYTVSGLGGANGVGYYWIVPTGWTIVSQSSGPFGDGYVTVVVGSDAGDILLNSFSGMCGFTMCYGMASLLSVTPIPTPSQPTVINGLVNPCQNTTTTYSVTNVSGMTFTWSVPAGWTLVSGQGTNSITVTTGTAGGTLSVTPSNTCGTGTAQTLTTTIFTNPPSAPSAITGSVSPCQNSSQIYSVTSDPGTTFTWTFPTGWTITAGQGTNSVIVTSGSAAGNVTVASSNGCGTNATTESLAVTPSPVPLQPPALTVPANPCVGSTQVYYFNGNAVESYAWTLPSGWVITNGGNTDSITVTVGASSGNIVVVPSNACGNGPSRSQFITVKTLPATPASITGSATPCLGTNQVYYVTNISGVTYTWSTPVDWTIVAGQNTYRVTVTVGPTGGNISVTPTNVCGSNIPRTKVVTVTAIPSQPSAISGTAGPCEGSSQVYSISNTSGVTYTWTCPSGWSIISGQGTSSVTVTAGAASGNVTATPSNSCGSGLAQTVAISTSPLPVQPPAISGQTDPCSGTTLSYYFTGNTGENYAWTVPMGWSIISGDGTDSISVTAGNSGGNIQVVPSNVCGNGTAQTIAVAPANVPAQPPAISGQADPCSGTTVSYYFTGNAGENYTWTVPSGWSIISGDGTDSISVTAGSIGGNIQVVPSNVCGNGTAQNLAVTTTNVPAQSSVITGQTNPCTGTTLSYYFTGNAGENYTWTVPSGWSIISGDGTDSVSVAVGSIGGNIQVVPSNVCGDGTAQTIAVAPTNVPAQPATISGQADPCTGTTVSYYFTGNAGENYTWTVPSGWSIISGDGTDSISVTAGINGGNIQVVPSNVCGNGTAQTIAVAPTNVPAPPAAISGQADPCSGTTLSYYFTGNAGENYAWTVPSGWSIISGDGTDSISVTAGSSGGNIQVVPSNVCGNGTASELSVQPVPTITPGVSISVLPGAEVCEGISIDLTAIPSNGGTNPVFSWYIDGIFTDNGSALEIETPVNGSEIYVTMSSDLPCVTQNPAYSDSIIVSVHQYPIQPLITPIGDTLFSSCAAVFNQWYLNGQVIPGETSEDLFVSLDGMYYTICTDSFGCSSISDTILITTSGIHSGNFRIYPNPATEVLMIENFKAASGNIRIEIIALTGQMVREWEFEGSETYRLDLSGLLPGVYTLEMVTANGTVHARFIKE